MRMSTTTTPPLAACLTARLQPGREPPKPHDLCKHLEDDPDTAYIDNPVHDDHLEELPVHKVPDLRGKRFPCLPSITPSQAPLIAAAYVSQTACATAAPPALPNRAAKYAPPP